MARTFSVDGDTYNFPESLENLSFDDLMQKIIEVRQANFEAGNEGAAEAKIAEIGFEDGHHFEEFQKWMQEQFHELQGDKIVRLSFEDGSSLDFEVPAKYLSNGWDYVQFLFDLEKEYNEKKLAQNVEGEKNGILAPVEGISLEQWAEANAKIVGGQEDVNNIISSLGIDKAKWDKVNDEWMARMSQDTTFTISQVYSKAFTGGGAPAAGQQSADSSQAGSEGEPMSFEKYVEILVASDAATKQGKNIEDVYADFGITIMDWSKAGMYWSQKMQEDVEKYYNLQTELTKKFSEKYGLTEE